ncbi:SIS domain-containing protein [Amnibacterium flavum]|uniref:KpsF/GutQ family sugar-phosphate isomerase n=1 Tax=Amnibacterium flavum TaxID=2173173 RepID=UPI00196AB6C8|nr:SIS domain-containing protein [Amnibacterium flavum]
MDSPALAAAREVVLTEAAAVAAVAAQLDDTFDDVVEEMLACEGKVFVTGSGTSGAVARRMAHLLSVCGTPSAYINAMDALHGTMGVLTAADLLVSISRGGESGEINDLSTRAQKRGVKVIAVTAEPRSALGELADITVVLRTDEAGDPGGVIAMGSTLVTAVWGDALANVLMRRRDYGFDKVLDIHPAGAVGLTTQTPDSLAAIAGSSA